MRKSSSRAACVTMLAALLFLPASGFAPDGADAIAQAPYSDPQAVSNALRNSGFTENAGQLRDERVHFYASSGGMRIGLTSSGVLLDLIAHPSVSDSGPHEWNGFPGSGGVTPATVRGALIRLTFEGSNFVAPVGRDELPHRSHFFLGNDLANWRTDVRSYGEAIYENLYNGIDLVYRTDSSGLKYDFHVRPGADPGDIRIAYEGIDSLDVRSESLVLRTAAGDLRDERIVATAGGVPVACEFVRHQRSRSGFACSGWDGEHTLVIDPLLWATFLGGLNGDNSLSVALDPLGNSVVAGLTISPDFPVTPGAYDIGFNGGPGDAFVAKLSEDGSSLLWSTFLGGSAGEEADGLALDTFGNPVVVGQTLSFDFPVTPGANDTSFNGGAGDAFAAKLSGDGSVLVWSTFLGGSAVDFASTLVLEPSGNAVLTGYTESADFPATPGAYDTSFNGGQDAFVAKLSSDGATFLWNTFLGGSGGDAGRSLDQNASGSVVVAGYTTSADLPSSPGAYDMTYNGMTDAFTAQISSDGSGLQWSTFLGGVANDVLLALALDPSERPILAGYTSSSDFPVTPGAYDTTFNGAYDAFVAQLGTDGTILSWATFLGGSLVEVTHALVLDPSGLPVVGGYTESADFPATPDAPDTTFNGVYDAFVAKVSSDGAGLLWATFLGGMDGDVSYGLAPGSSGNLVAAGQTFSANFPATPGAYDVVFNGGPGDAFLAKLSTVTLNAPPVANAGTDQVTVRNATVILNGSGSFDPNGDPLTYLWNQTGGPNMIPITNATMANATVVPTMIGTYTFRLTVNDTVANASDFVDVTVLNRGPIANAGPDQGVFENTFVTLTGVSSADPDGDPLSFNWTWVAGPQPIVLTNSSAATPTFTSPNGASVSGVYSFSVLVTDTFGANSTDGVDVTVSNRPPVANAGPDQNLSGQFSVVTLNGSASFDPDGEPISYFWWQTTGPGPVTFTAQTSAVTNFSAVGAGVYLFVLYVNDPENTNVSDNVTVTVGNIPPTAALSVNPNPVRVGDPAIVDASGSSDSDGSIAQYNFTFGDGTTSGNVTTPLVVHSWSLAATYAVNVTVWDNNGATDTRTVNVTAFVDAPPTANASVTPGTTGTLTTLFTFHGSNSTDDNGIVAWRWEFGDGNTATTPNATHMYATRGTFLVTLTVWDVFNQSDADNLTIMVVNRPPTADAGVDQTVAKKTLVTLDATGSADPDPDILSYEWSNVSGPSVVLIGPNTARPTFTPATSGVYVLRVNVSDGMGGFSEDEVTVTATNGVPLANAGPDQIVPRKNLLVTLDGRASSDPDGDALSYAWTQTGGTNVTLTGASTDRPTFTPTVVDIYTFQLLVDDDDGGTRTDPVSVDVRNQLPVASLTANPTLAAVGQTVTFTGGASPDDGTLVNWTLLFGDGTQVSGSGAPTTRTHPYAASGSYVATLWVTDDDGASDSATALVAVDNPPNAVAGPDQNGTLATTFAFDGGGSTDDNGIVAWRWDFGDGSPDATTATASHLYTQRGTFNVNLTVWDARNQIDTDNLTVVVRNRVPTADAGLDQRNVTIGVAVTLNGAGSSDPDLDALTYTWTMTSGPTSVTLTNPNTASPRFTPTIAGTYVFSLVVSDGTDSSALDSVSVTVAPPAPPPPNNTLLLLGPILAALAVFLLVAFAFVRRRRTTGKKMERGKEEPRERPKERERPAREEEELPPEEDEDWDLEL